MIPRPYARFLIASALSALLVLPGCSTTPADTTPSETADANNTLPYAIVDTGQSTCYDSEGIETSCPTQGEALYGQDAQYQGNEPSYTDNGDGTTSDNVTGLMWQRSPDTDGDGDINATDKLTIDQAESYCSKLTLAGHSDWRLPTIKELYSLILFTGTDPSGYEGTDTSGLVPFIDTDYFDFAYGDTSANERIIDSQYASSTHYVAEAAEQLLFGVNFADGRIKGYGLSLRGTDKTFFVIAVRGRSDYGVNDYENNGNGTITDHATNLMWSQDDSGAGLDWGQALDLVQKKNEESYHGHADWRLPNAKELQSIVDYTRSPDTANFGASDPIFTTSVITNEAGQIDYPWYWCSTTHANFTRFPGSSAVYVAFGRGLGYMDGEWRDVHGAGCQRSDPKMGDPSDFPEGRGPQGDAIRIYNYVRLVRDATDQE